MRRALLLAVVGAAVWAPAAAAQRAGPVLTVTNFSDATPETGEDGPVGSLRYVVTREGAPGATIRFALPDAVISLTRPLHVPVGLEGLTIEGPVTLRDVSAMPTYSSGTDGGFGLFVEAPDVRLEHVTFWDVPVVVKGDLGAKVAGASLQDDTFKGRHGVLWLHDADGAQVGTESPNTWDGTQDHAIDVDLSDGVTIAGNVFRNAGPGGIRVTDSHGTTIRGNRLHGVGIALQTFDATLAANTIDGAAQNGVDVDPPSLLEGAAAVTIQGGSVVGGRGAGIDASGDRVSLQVVGATVQGNRRAGIVFAHGAHGAVRQGTVAENRGAGVDVAGSGIVTISGVAMHGNGGPGIDLAPPGVSKTPSANGGIPTPKLDWDEGQKALRVTTCPGCTVEVFRTESGPRLGNPHNGEGAALLASLVADGGGVALFRPGQIGSCDEAKPYTATATNQAGATSEFGDDVVCSGLTYRVTLHVTGTQTWTRPAVGSYSGSGASTLDVTWLARVRRTPRAQLATIDATEADSIAGSAHGEWSGAWASSAGQQSFHCAYDLKAADVLAGMELVGGGLDRPLAFPLVGDAAYAATQKIGLAWEFWDRYRVVPLVPPLVAPPPAQPRPTCTPTYLARPGWLAMREEVDELAFVGVRSTSLIAVSFPARLLGEKTIALRPVDFSGSEISPLAEFGGATWKGTATVRLELVR